MHEGRQNQENCTEAVYEAAKFKNPLTAAADFTNCFHPPRVGEFQHEAGQHQKREADKQAPMLHDLGPRHSREQLRGENLMTDSRVPSLLKLSFRLFREVKNVVQKHQPDDAENQHAIYLGNPKQQRIFPRCRQNMNRRGSKLCVGTGVALPARPGEIHFVNR